jgi:hypothetical protein
VCPSVEGQVRSFVTRLDVCHAPPLVSTIAMISKLKSSPAGVTMAASKKLQRRQSRLVRILTTTLLCYSSSSLFLTRCISNTGTASAFLLVGLRREAVRFHCTANRLGMTTSDDPLAGLPLPLLLGSASFTRKLILKEMGIDFQIVVRPIDEKSLGDRFEDAPRDLVLTLAQAKMEHLVQEIKAGRCQEELSSYEKGRSWIVLTGDQVVMCQGFT